MCGIAGVISTASVVPDALPTALAALTHRGPDGDGIERFDATGARCALGHRRLAILDLSPAGRQPMASADGRAWIVFNGEIYDYLELREELAKLGHSFKTRTDTEVLLAAWTQWGPEMLPRLNGMFALAIWDGPRSLLFLARDRFGEKPLHWKEDGTSLVFASELRAIRAFERVGQIQPSRIDDAWLYRFLQFGRVEADDATMLEGVRRLPPGHCMTVYAREGRLEADTDRWYDLAKARAHVRVPSDPAQTFRDLFDDSVRLRLRSDVPVGTSLSGGIDSGSIVTTMSALLDPSGTQHTFTCRMEDPALDEGRYSSATAAAARAHLHEIRPAAEDLRRDFDALVAAQGEPFQSASLYAQWRVFERAKQEGVTVLLDGQGADEILAGYGIFTAVAAGREMSRGRLAAARRILEAAPVNVRAQTSAEAKQYALRGLLRGAIGRAAERWRMPRGSASAAIVSEDARRRFGRPERLRPELGAGSWLDAWLRFATTEGPLQMLLRFADRNSMAHSREVRLPFLDHRLVELCFALPDEWKIGDRWTKRLLREAMAGRVPDEVRLRREKIGFEAPDVLWLTGPLREWALERIDASIARFKGLIDGAAARELRGHLTHHDPRRKQVVATLFPWISAEAAVRGLE